MEVLTRTITHINGWVSAVYVSYMCENFRLFHVSTASVLNFRFFSTHVPGAGVISQRSGRAAAVTMGAAPRAARGGTVITGLSWPPQSPPTPAASQSVPAAGAVAVWCL